MLPKKSIKFAIVFSVNINTILYTLFKSKKFKIKNAALLSAERNHSKKNTCFIALG
jgi:hypothetical protein